LRIDCSTEHNVAILKQFVAISRGTLRRFSDEEGMHLAAGIAFYALMSLFPVALIFVSIFSFIYTPEQVTDFLVRFFGEQAPVAPRFLKEAVEGAQAVRGPVAVLGTAGLVLTSSLVFAAIMRAINRAWGLIGTGTRRFMKRKLWELTLMASAALLFFIALAATNIIDALRDGPFPGTDFRLDPDSFFLRFLLGLAPLIALFSVLLLLYKYVPTTRVQWRDVWFPSLIGAAALLLASNVMTWYISTLGYYDAMYGSLTTVILLLLWIYVCSNILIGGAALSAVLSDFRCRAEAAEAAAREECAPGPATTEPGAPASDAPEPANLAPSNPEPPALDDTGSS